MARTKIEWADEVWNPVTGCTKVSQGCKNCYAERIYERFHPGQKFTDVHMHLGKLGDPLHWKKPRRVFVNSMSDLFHPQVPYEFILRAWMMMAGCSQHTFLILTKRPERMMIFITEWLPGAWGLATMSLQLLDYPISNIWLGVSAEDQKAADERIPLLLRTPAAVRFVSVEPMLGGMDLSPYLAVKIKFDDLGPFRGLDWVICGGESGPKARPMHPDWARGLRDQCVDASVPFFFKQWGEWAPADDQSRAWQFDRKDRANQIAWWTVSSSTNKKSIGRRDPVAYDEIGKATLLERVGKKAAGRVLDGKTHDEYPGVE